LRLLQLWNDWAVYDSTFLLGLEALFLSEPFHLIYKRLKDTTNTLNFRLKVYYEEHAL
jgi:hypothetical protein